MKEKSSVKKVYNGINKIEIKKLRKWLNITASFNDNDDDSKR